MRGSRADSSFVMDDTHPGSGSQFERGYSGSEVDFDDRGDIMTPDQDYSENFKVAIRVRPPVRRELEGPRPFINVVRIPADHTSITLCDVDADDGHGSVYATQSYTFDVVYGPEARQRDVYDRSAHPAVMSVLQGYNATLMAYGQTGTGKTYTMEGFTNDEHRGIIPNATEEIFDHIQRNRNPNVQFKVRASYLQIYKEVVSDLLKPPSTKGLTIRQSKSRTVVENLSEWIVTSPDGVFGLMEKGCSVRATSATKMSELSSRSHAIFQLIVEILEGPPEGPQSYKVGKLNIVDLAGSEKVRATGVTGQRLEEAKKINWSLHQLGNVISSLTDPNRRADHIPYRNSKLTQLLTDSLGGNCKTTLIACISPAFESYSESVSTLKFANRAKNIKNEAVVNEEADTAALVVKYEKEIARLKTQLIERDGPSAELRPQHDRNGMMEQLQARDRMYDEEKRQKQRLETRVGELERQLMSSGVLDGDDRSNQREDVAQVERYKQLLLKQRDIMLNLTQRLNERDEAILKLQEEIDAYDEHIADLEAALEEKEAQLGGKGNSSSAAERKMSTADATRHIANTKVFVRGEPRYQSEHGGQKLLTAEEKMIELLSANGVPELHRSAAGSGDVRVLEDALTARLDEVAARVVRDKCAALVEDLAATKAKLAKAEQELRTGSLANEIARSPNLAQQSDRIREYVAQETSHLRRSLSEQIETLKHQLATDREHVGPMQSEVERMAFELRRLRETAEPSRRAEVEAMVKEVQRIEDRMRRHTLASLDAVVSTVKAPTSHVDPTSNPSSLRIMQLESTIDTLRKQKDTRYHEMQAQLDEKASRLRQLESATEERERSDATIRQRLASHEKDRAALKKILEQRVKVKLDNIANALRGGTDPRLVEREMESLQSLVNASIQAMISDQAPATPQRR